jgi:multicomponent Na+:H+ antiporter subunit C
MTVNLVMAVTIGVLYAAGFYLMLTRSLMRVLIGVVVLGHASNLLLQVAGGPPGRAPIVGSAPPETMTDPLPQALALTAIVITFALTTFLLALGYRSFVLVGHDEVQDDVEDRRIGRHEVLPTGLDADSDDGDDSDETDDRDDGGDRRDDRDNGGDVDAEAEADATADGRGATTADRERR